MKALKIIISSLKNTKFFVIVFFIFSILVSYFTTYIPIIIQYFIDVLLKENTANLILDFITKSSYGEKFGLIPTICVTLIMVQVVLNILIYVRDIVKNKIIQEFQYHLKLKLFCHIQNLTYQDFYHNSLADLVQNSSDDVNHIVQFIENQLTYILDIVLVVIFAIIQLVTIDFRLSSVMIVLSSIIFGWSIYYCKRSKAVIQKRIEMQKRLYAKMNDNFDQQKFIKVNNLQEKEKDAFGRIVDESNQFHKEKIKIDANYNTGVENIVKIRSTTNIYFK